MKNTKPLQFNKRGTHYEVWTPSGLFQLGTIAYYSSRDGWIYIPNLALEISLHPETLEMEEITAFMKHLDPGGE